VLTYPTKKAGNTGFGPDKTFRGNGASDPESPGHRRRNDPVSRALPHIGPGADGKGPTSGAWPELVPSGLLRHGDCDDGEAIDASEVGGVAGIYR